VTVKRDWTDADFEGMSWHDSYIHGFYLDNENQALVLDIDSNVDSAVDSRRSPSPWPSPQRGEGMSGYCIRIGGGRRFGAGLTSGSSTRARAFSSARPWMRLTISPRLSMTTV